MQCIPINGKSPIIAKTAFVASGSCIIGDVSIGEGSSIWYNCVLRGDVNSIRIGARSNIQDGSVIHVDSPKGSGAGLPTIIGDDVLIGHMATVHGSILHDRAFVGLGSIVMDGCIIESDGMLAAGAMLTPGKVIGARELWMGRPARKLRNLSLEEIAANKLGVAHYVQLAKVHNAALKG